MHSEVVGRQQGVASCKESETLIEKKKTIKYSNCSKCCVTDHGKAWKLFVKSSYMKAIVDNKKIYQ